MTNDDEKPKKPARKPSEEQKRRIAESNKRRTDMQRDRRAAIDELQKKAFAGEELDQKDLRKFAIVDALEDLRSSDPDTRARGQSALDDLCPNTELEHHHDPMRPRG
jgi:hypothetical protein